MSDEHIFRRVIEPTVMKPLAVPHDFRRTTVRDLERVGVAGSVAMELVERKTESVY
jgi:hypothetical protein